MKIAIVRPTNARTNFRHTTKDPWERLEVWSELGGTTCKFVLKDEGARTEHLNINNPGITR